MKILNILFMANCVLSRSNAYTFKHQCITQSVPASSTRTFNYTCPMSGTFVGGFGIAYTTSASVVYQSTSVNIDNRSVDVTIKNSHGTSAQSSVVNVLWICKV